MSEEQHPGSEKSGITRRQFVQRGRHRRGRSREHRLHPCAAGRLRQLGLGRRRSSPSPAAATTALPSGGLSALEAAAKAEGKINTIALPPDWANYGEIISTFQSKYGITVNNANPNGTSAQENTAITTLKGQSRAPDVVDVGPSFAARARPAASTRPTSWQTWATIPDSMKDPAGYWYGDYYGVISFGTNTNVQKTPPQDWSDLLNPRYKGQVAIDGDPRSANDAFSAVFAASLANGGSLDDIEPGINFFAKLKKAGNYIPADALPANISKGSTPIAIIWDYLNLANKKTFAGNPPYTVSIPKTGVYGGFYCQAISATAPNPQRRAPLAGVHLLRRGPAALPRGLHAPGALRRPGQAQRHPRRAGRHAAVGERVRRHPVRHAGPAHGGDQGPHRAVGPQGSRLKMSSTCGTLVSRGSASA